MEIALGIQLDDVWKDMGFQGRWTVTESIAHYQSAWTSIRFKRLWSLYYAQDLDQQSFDGPLAVDEHGDAITDKKSAVGLSNGRDCVDNGKADIGFDRGPCETCSNPDVLVIDASCLGDTSETYLSAIGYIDWQATELAPLFNQLRQPYFLDHDEPSVRGSNVLVDQSVSQNSIRQIRKKPMPCM